MLGAGRLVLHVPNVSKALVLDNVLFISAKEKALKKRDEPAGSAGHDRPGSRRNGRPEPRDSDRLSDDDAARLRSGLFARRLRESRDAGPAADGASRAARRWAAVPRAVRSSARSRRLRSSARIGPFMTSSMSRSRRAM